jgi:hypothetical protein
MIGTRTTLLGMPTILCVITVAVYFSKEKKPSLFERLGLLILIIIFIVSGVYLVHFLYANDMFETMARVQEMTSSGYEVRGRLPEGISAIKDFTFLEHLIGVGEERFALVENDVVDLYGKFGFPFLMIIYGSCLYFLFSIYKVFFRYRGIAALSLCMGLSLYLIHGSLAGHAFASAQVNNLIMVVYFLIYRYTLNQNLNFKPVKIAKQ